MAKKLLIVESPAKARTLKKYLGPGYEVLASYGHVRDLLPKEGAVVPENGFTMKYQLIAKNEKHVNAIAKQMKKADALYLATDPDREGEAISWHLYEILKQQGALKDKPVYRVVFHEITKSAILDAINHPRQLLTELIDAQQARRALDYLVGFNLSPLLWKKIRTGLSAGRVQSPALRLIVEREREIEDFKPREYWTIEADSLADDSSFIAKLHQYHGNKLTQFSITTEQQAADCQHTLRNAASGQLQVTEVEKKQRKRNPVPPFTTSTLQQEASRKLGFSTQRTMRTAQQLYEGIETGDGSVGLISYMRTDSVTLASEAIEEIRQFIGEQFGASLVPHHPNIYKTKTKNAQEAHEAIRPTSVARTPASVRSHLTNDQFRLYELIWKRTVACQMVPALINTVAINLAAGQEGIFRTTGSTIAAPGFMSVYHEGRDDQPSKEEDRLLPPLGKGDIVQLKQIRKEQHFTEPPPRYSEATLVKALEEYGIGRPSTYASIISTLQAREYAVLEKRRFRPTDVGRIVNKFLTAYFQQYVNYEFTANLEDELDAVSRGEEAWVPVLERFWEPFRKRVENVQENVTRKDVTQEILDEKCPQCGEALVIRLGRHGRFIGCSTYPQCDYTRDVNGDAQANTAELLENRFCPECNEPLVVKTGRYGKFIGCSKYPDCTYIEPLNKPVDTGVQCPQCRNGRILERRARSGKIFYSCSTYPKCNYAVWNMPLAEACPQCGWPILTIKTTKRRGTEKVCPQKHCDFHEAVEIEAEGVT